MDFNLTIELDGEVDLMAGSVEAVPTLNNGKLTAPDLHEEVSYFAFLLAPRYRESIRPSASFGVIFFVFVGLFHLPPAISQVGTGV